MEKLLIYMIVGVSLLMVAAIGLGVYAWKLSRKFPHAVKAKVLRVEAMPDGKNKYHFECKKNGIYIAEDTITYKEKKFKVGEKTKVRMNRKGNMCHSNFPMWPIVSSIVCVVLAIVLALAYVADKRSEKLEEESGGGIYQETGYYIVTDTDTFLYGDNLGLTIVEETEGYASTGDYGNVIFIGNPKYESGSIIPRIKSAGSNVNEDGVPDDLPSDAIKRIERLGYTINYEVTDSKTLIEANKEELEPETEDGHEGHDHGDEEALEEGNSIEIDVSDGEVVLEGTTKETTATDDIDTTSNDETIAETTTATTETTEPEETESVATETTESAEETVEATEEASSDKKTTNNKKKN